MKRRTIVFVGIAVVIIGAFWAFSGKESKTVVSVKQISAVKGDIDVYIEADGIVAAEKANLNFSQAGIVDSLAVKVGDQVSAGQTLATLDASKAQYQVEQASSAYNAAVAKADRVKPGTNGEEVVAKQQAVQSAQIALDAERAIYNDTVSKYGADSSQAISENAKLKKAEADLAGAQAQLNLTYATYDDARYTAQTALANLHIAQTTLGDAVLTAPIDGIVTAVNGALGQYASVSQQTATAFITIAKPDTLKIVSYLDEEDISKVTVGQTVRAEFSSIGKNLDGTVTYVSPVAKTDTNGAVTYEVFIALPPSSTVRDGMTASLKFITKSVQDVVKIPNKAVKLKDASPYVEYYDAAKNIQRKDVQTGFTDGQYVEITSGLVAGDALLLPSSEVKTSGS